MMNYARPIVIALILGALLSPGVPAASAEEIASFAFRQPWARTDLPVEIGRISRSWTWGTKPFTGLIREPYVEGKVKGERGSRMVQYFDKGRMQITDLDADSSSPSYVSYGLLSTELITGRLQIGDEAFAEYEPAEINIAGDPDDLNAPTYATLTPLLEYQPIPVGWPIIQTIDGTGNVTSDESLAGHGVTAATLVAETNHTVASVFWDYMRSTGLIYDGWTFHSGALFDYPFAVTGFPITEPYWTTVKVGGQPKRVLVQAFQRRVLTYTPDNPDGWKVESGNVGAHYYQWRYSGKGDAPAIEAVNVNPVRDGDGNWVFLGELQNNARATYTRVKVTVNLYDEADVQVASSTGYLDLSLLEPEERLPFRVWFDTDPQFVRQEIVIQPEISQQYYRPEIATATRSVSLTAGQRYAVRGQLRNAAQRPVDEPTYVVVLYDADGKIIGYDWGFLEETNLEPGATANFAATFYHPAPDFATYRVFVSD